MKSAVFAGSFNPFTIGHADIVARGLQIFDHIYVCIGINPTKDTDGAEAEARAQQIRTLYKDEPRVTVECNSGLTAAYALSRGACALLRGIRSVKDMEYERDMADANRTIYGIETVVLYTDPQYSWVSSSLVRELQRYGQDTSHLLPKPTE